MVLRFQRAVGPDNHAALFLIKKPPGWRLIYSGNLFFLSIESENIHAIQRNLNRGSTPGNSANNKYNAFMNMLQTAADMLQAGDSKGACGLLNSIMNKCDGSPSPPEFIDGNTDTMGTLTGMIDDLTASLGCE
jgi:hypothetical protein